MALNVITGMILQVHPQLFLPLQHPNVNESYSNPSTLVSNIHLMPTPSKVDKNQTYSNKQDVTVQEIMIQISLSTHIGMNFTRKKKRKQTNTKHTKQSVIGSLIKLRSSNASV